MFTALYCLTPAYHCVTLGKGSGIHWQKKRFHHQNLLGVTVIKTFPWRRGKHYVGLDGPKDSV